MPPHRTPRIPDIPRITVPQIPHVIVPIQPAPRIGILRQTAPPRRGARVPGYVSVPAVRETGWEEADVAGADKVWSGLGAFGFGWEVPLSGSVDD
jgi:hypothetical protein